MEHRRAQNRLAQRRFRQKHQQQKAAEKLQKDVQRDSESYTLEYLSRGSISPRYANSSHVTAESTGAFPSTSIFGSNALLDNISFVNMDNIYTTDSDSTSKSTFQDLATVSDLDERSLNGFSNSNSPARTESISGYGAKAIGPLILTSGSSKSSGWLSPLHIAARNGNDRIVRTLMQHNIDCNETDSDGSTALIYATIGGFKDVVKSLLSQGARIGKVDNQSRSALHWAVVHHHEELLRVLLAYCTKDKDVVDGYDKKGMTPLHTAVDVGFEEGVQILLQFGANVHYMVQKP